MGILLPLLNLRGQDHEVSSLPAEETLDAAAVCSSRWTWLTSAERWDSRYRLTTESIVGAVDRLDRFFGEERITEESRKTSLVIGIGLQRDGNEGLKLLSDFRLRLSLPRLEGRLQLVLDDAFEVDQPNDRLTIAPSVSDVKPDAGLRYYLAQDKNVDVSADLRVRLRGSLQFFVRTRGSVRIPMNEWDTRLTETLYWFTDDGWREVTELSFNRVLPNAWLFRSSSRLTWEETRNGVNPGQVFSVTRKSGKRQAWRLYLAGDWPEVSHTREANYAAGVVYRRRVHRDWLFLEFTPSIEFPQEYDYALNTVFGVKLEVTFSEN